MSPNQSCNLNQRTDTREPLTARRTCTLHFKLRSVSLPHFSTIFATTKWHRCLVSTCSIAIACYLVSYIVSLLPIESIHLVSSLITTLAIHPFIPPLIQPISGGFLHSLPSPTPPPSLTKARRSTAASTSQHHEAATHAP